MGNNSKRGKILYKDMWQTVRNAEFKWKNKGKRLRFNHISEEDYLKKAIEKAQSRIKQIQEDN